MYVFGAFCSINHFLKIGSFLMSKNKKLLKLSMQRNFLHYCCCNKKILRSNIHLSVCVCCSLNSVNIVYAVPYFPVASANSLTLIIIITILRQISNTLSGVRLYLSVIASFSSSFLGYYHFKVSIGIHGLVLESYKSMLYSDLSKKISLHNSTDFIMIQSIENICCIYIFNMLKNDIESHSFYGNLNMHGFT